MLSLDCHSTNMCQLAILIPLDCQLDATLLSLLQWGVPHITTELANTSPLDCQSNATHSINKNTQANPHPMYNHSAANTATPFCQSSATVPLGCHSNQSTAIRTKIWVNSTNGQPFCQLFATLPLECHWAFFSATCLPNFMGPCHSNYQGKTTQPIASPVPLDCHCFAT